MAGWDDLVPKALPALCGGGLEVEGLAEHSTWLIDLVVNDDADTAVDWTGVTGEGHIYSRRDGGTVVANWTVDLSTPGHVVCRLEEADTIGLANPNAAHAIWLTKAGSPGERIAVCLPYNSPCPIRSED